MTEVGQERSNQMRIDVIRRWPSRSAKNWVTSFVDAACKDVNIVAVVAIGSAVRVGVSSADLDLLVLIVDLTLFKARPPIEVDLRPFAVSQTDALLTGGNDLLGWAVKYGRLVLEKGEVWTRFENRWHDRVPLPSAEVSLKRASEAYRRYSSMVEIGDFDAAFEQSLSYVTHVARSAILLAGRFPASRPELPKELRQLGRVVLANSLEKLVSRSPKELEGLAKIMDQVTKEESNDVRN